MQISLMHTRSRVGTRAHGVFVHSLFVFVYVGVCHERGEAKMRGREDNVYSSGLRFSSLRANLT